jgi:hypothetical protein
MGTVKAAVITEAIVLDGARFKQVTGNCTCRRHAAIVSIRTA